MKIQKYKKELNISYTLGTTLTYELLKMRPNIVNKIYLKTSINMTKDIENLLDIANKNDVNIEYNDKAFNILSPKGNCYAIGEFVKEHQKLESGNHIVLVNPSDAGNLGTIIRTSVGFGINNIAIIKPSVDFYDPKVVRASMGAIFHVNIEYFNSIEEYIDKFRENNRYAFMLRKSTNIMEIEKNEPFSLIFGNEATGLPDNYSEFNTSVLIKHSKNIDSLNLPMAVGISLFEFTKKYWEK